MTIRKTIQIGNTILKRRNRKVTNFDDMQVKALIKDLKDTMIKLHLIGIAAPQIGENYQIFLTQPRKTKSRNLPFKDELRVYVNPKIVKVSHKKTVIWEGCGCVGETDRFFGPVKRAKEVTVEASNEKGEKFQIYCDGILARVILHEMDHLNGIEFIEKVDDYSKLMHEKHYSKRIRNSKEQNKASEVTILEYKNISS